MNDLGLRKARFTDEEMVAILREADREPAGVVAKRHKVSEQTIYNWRKKFGDPSTHEVRRLKQLEAENTRTKKLGVSDEIFSRKSERRVSRLIALVWFTGGCLAGSQGLIASRHILGAEPTWRRSNLGDLIGETFPLQRCTILSPALGARGAWPRL